MELGFHKFQSGKRYAYAKIDGNPVFLRNIIFLTKGKHIVLVREWGARSERNVWEPPKGQMEWAEFASSGIKPHSKQPINVVYACMKKALVREMVEEAKVMPSEIKHFRRMPIHYTQTWPECELPNASFLYQFWTAELDSLAPAQKRMRTLVANPDWKLLLPADVTEKDAVMWWSPSTGWECIRNGFSKKMMEMYFEFKSAR